MRLTNLKSATVLIEEGTTRLLTDPWLIDGIYFGSWAHNPPYEWDAVDLSGITHIYVSHIHPDHLCERTMARFPKVPVIIHKFASPALRMMIEGMGFPVVELLHGQTENLGGLHITIMAADNCNPEICGRHFGCSIAYKGLQSTQIDTLAIIRGANSTLVNVNDCPFQLAEPMLEDIKRFFGPVDLLLVGYGGAGPYPQCFDGIDKASAAFFKKASFLAQGRKFIDALAPKHVMPFAGQYHLAGRLMPLNGLRGVPSLKEAAEFYADCSVVSLNTGKTFDVDHGEQSAPFVPDDGLANDYARENLAGRAYDYDADNEPGTGELRDMAAEAACRMQIKRKELGIKTNTQIVLPQIDVTILLDGGVSFKNGPRVPFVSIDCDRKLLKRLLSGPKVAHWSNAEIGSHLRFRREPDIFNRSISHLMGSSFYA